MPHKFFYPSTDADVGVVQYSSTAGASAALTKMVAAAAKKAIKARGAFTIALTGARNLCPAVALQARRLYALSHLRNIGEKCSSVPLCSNTFKQANISTQASTTIPAGDGGDTRM